VIKRMRLPYEPFAVAPYYAVKPEPAPASNPLYEGKDNVIIGVAEIASRLGRTGLDPILVAAAYNAGGLYRSTQNAWRLRSHGDHLDRAAKWYGDACFVMASLR
jgi:peptidoglycan L-alanyl-D-glutamate endopeptidase CwlK